MTTAESDGNRQGRAHVRLPLLLGLALIVAALALGLVVREGVGLDSAILEALALRPGTPVWLVGVTQGLSLLGRGGLRPFVILPGALWLIWRGRRWRAALGYVLGCLASLTLVTVLKDGFGRVRPELVPWLDGPTNASFPSGHSANTLVIVLLFALLAGRGPAVAAALLFGLAMGISRVFLGVHWPSDVLGGWLIGGGVALLALALVRWWEGMSRAR